MRFPIRAAVAAAVGLALSATAMADTLSKPEYKTAKASIESQYRSAKTACDALLANAKDVCVAEAKGREDIALAELTATNQPSQKTRYDLRLVKANAAYSVSAEKCDDLAGNAKDVCVKEAEAVRTSAKADAKSQNKIAEVRKDAALEKREADYAVAREKCDALAGAVKDACVSNAKARYGKS